MIDEFGLDNLSEALNKIASNKDYKQQSKSYV